MSATDFESIPTTQLAGTTGGRARAKLTDMLRPGAVKSSFKAFKPAPPKLTNFARLQEPISYVKPKAKSGAL